MNFIYSSTNLKIFYFLNTSYLDIIKLLDYLKQIYSGLLPIETLLKIYKYSTIVL